MNWAEPVDLYCERVDAALWAEPFNTFTNAAFLIGAATAFVQWRRSRAPDWPVLALIAIMAIIGAGSFAFHTLATRGAVLLDVIPIGIFVYGYFLLAIRRFLNLRWSFAAAALVGFFGVSQALSMAVPRGLLNGSIDYLPPLAAMAAIGALVRDDHLRRALLTPAALFAVSLTFRTVDNVLCGAIPTGTHFIWHMLNAVVLYALLRAAMTYNPPART
jgi:hypothetical protein